MENVALEMHKSLVSSLRCLMQGGGVQMRSGQMMFMDRDDQPYRLCLRDNDGNVQPLTFNWAFALLEADLLEFYHVPHDATMEQVAAKIDELNLKI